MKSDLWILTEVLQNELIAWKNTYPESLSSRMQQRKRSSLGILLFAHDTEGHDVDQKEHSDRSKDCQVEKIVWSKEADKVQSKRTIVSYNMLADGD